MKAYFNTAVCLFILIGTISTAHADHKADTLLQKVVKAYKAASTLSGTLTNRVGVNQYLVVTREKFALKRPKLLHVAVLSEQETKSGLTQATGSVGDVTVSDGKEKWHYNRAANTYSKSKADTSGIALLVNLFYTPDALPSVFSLSRTMQAIGLKSTTTKRYIGRRIFQGVNYNVVELTEKSYAGAQTGPIVETIDIYIGADELIYRLVSVMRLPKKYQSGPVPLNTEETMTGLQVNKPIPASEFTFVPPPGATLKSNK
jgi:outer membrane lipoprotein-sorting protein